jgi:outer membrane protein assembly factor BamB/hydrogenase/urease accessory protein HupE
MSQIKQVLFVMCVLCSCAVAFYPRSLGTNQHAFVSGTLPMTSGAAANSDQTGDDWPMFHGGLNLNGSSSTTAEQGTGPSWVVNTGNSVDSSPVVVGDRVFVGNDYNKTYCLNVTSGAILWSYQTGGVFSDSPAVAGGFVYVASDKMYCLNATTGELAWAYNTGSWEPFFPVISNGLLYFGSTNSTLYCLNATTGAIAWLFESEYSNDIYSPAIWNGRAYAGSSGVNRFYCLNASTGGLIWTQYSILSASVPAIAYGQVYVGSFEGDLYCLNATDGTILWSYNTGNEVLTCPAVSGGRVFLAGDGITCLDAFTGAWIWNYTTSDYLEMSCPAVAGGLLFGGSYDNDIYCLNVSTGAVVWLYATHNFVVSSPALAGGRVYIGSEDGRIYCMPMLLLPSGVNPISVIVPIIVIGSIIVLGALIVITSRRFRLKEKSIWTADIFGWKTIPNGNVRGSNVPELQEAVTPKPMNGAGLKRRKLGFVTLVIASGALTVSSAVYFISFLTNLTDFAPWDSGNPFHDAFVQASEASFITMFFLILLLVYCFINQPLFQKVGTPVKILRNQSITAWIALSFFALFICLVVSIWFSVSDVADGSPWFRFNFWYAQWTPLLYTLAFWIGALLCLLISWYLARTIVRGTQHAFIQICPICGREIELTKYGKCLSCAQVVCNKCLVSGLCRSDFERLDNQTQQVVKKWHNCKRVFWKGGYFVICIGCAIVLPFYLPGFPIVIAIIVAAIISGYLAGKHIKTIAGRN